MRDRLVLVTVAALCILAVGLGAASLTGSIGGDGAGTPVTDVETNETDDDVDVGQPNEGNGGPTQAKSIQEDDECIAGYDRTSISWAVTAFAGGIALLVFVRTREPMLGVIAFPVVIVPAFLAMTIAFIVLGCPVPGESVVSAAAEQNFSTQAANETLNGGEEGASSLWNRLILGGMFLAIVLVIFAVGVYIDRRNSDTTPEETLPIGSTVDSAIAAAAGDGADRIDAATDAENGVFRAWARMTEPLEVEHPDSSTPREFADAALAAGVDPEDVSELTRLFETVRYGTETVTPAQEERALEILRRIERTHGDYANRAEDDGTGPGESTGDGDGPTNEIP